MVLPGSYETHCCVGCLGEPKAAGINPQKEKSGNSEPRAVDGKVLMLTHVLALSVAVMDFQMFRLCPFSEVEMAELRGR